MNSVSPSSVSTTDAMKAWRQGDLILDADLISQILSDLSFIDPSGKEIVGVALMTQTCDILKSADKHPMVDLCALVKCDSNTLNNVKGRKMVRYAYVPAAESVPAVVDLTIPLPFTKTRLMALKRVDGGFDHDEAGTDSTVHISRFQDCLKRSKARFAFPDNFNEFKKRLKEGLNALSKVSDDARKRIGAIEGIFANTKITDGEVLAVNLFFLLDSDKNIGDEDVVTLNKELNQLFNALNDDNAQFPSSFRIIKESEISLESFRALREVDLLEVS